VVKFAVSLALYQAIFFVTNVQFGVGGDEVQSYQEIYKDMEKFLLFS